MTSPIALKAAEQISRNVATLTTLGHEKAADIIDEQLKPVREALEGLLVVAESAPRHEGLRVQAAFDKRIKAARAILSEL